jgi:hypothetical protein
MKFKNQLPWFRKNLKIQLLISSLLVFFSLLSVIFYQAPSTLLLYASENEKTNEAFRMYYESESPILKASYQHNGGEFLPFSSGTLFSNEGIYHFEVINTTRANQRKTIILDQSPPKIRDFDASKTYHIGETIFFTDQLTQVNEIIVTIDEQMPIVLTQNRFQFNQVGEYTIQIFDELGNQQIYFLSVEFNAVFSIDASLYFISAFIIIFLAFMLYFLFKKTNKGNHN